MITFDFPCPSALLFVFASSGIDISMLFLYEDACASVLCLESSEFHPLTGLGQFRLQKPKENRSEGRKPSVFFDFIVSRFTKIGFGIGDFVEFI